MGGGEEGKEEGAGGGQGEPKGGREGGKEGGKEVEDATPLAPLINTLNITPPPPSLPLAPPPLPGAVTKTIVTSGRALAAEARRRK